MVGRMSWHVALRDYAANLVEDDRCPLLAKGHEFFEILAAKSVGDEIRPSRTLFDIRNDLSCRISWVRRDDDGKSLGADIFLLTTIFESRHERTRDELTFVCSMSRRYLF